MASYPSDKPRFRLDPLMPAAADRRTARHDRRTSRLGDAAGPTFAGETEARQLGPMAVFERRLTGRMSAWPRLEGAGLAPRQFVLHLLLAGEMIVFPDEAADASPEDGIIADPGDILVFDSGRPPCALFRNAHVLAVAIPQEELGGLVDGIAYRRGTLLKAPAAGLLGDMMVSLNRHLMRLGPLETAAASRAFRDLLAIALRSLTGGDRGGTGEFGKLEQARAAIERRLASPHLSPAAIAAEIGLSRSRLYELFRPFGGVAGHIQERRAVRLKALLSDPREPRSIAALAFAVGFASESHASRTFRQMFGMPPGQFRRAMRGGGTGIGPVMPPLAAEPPLVSLVAAVPG